MNAYQSLNHTKWECKYHIVWIPKYRKKKLYIELRKLLGEVFRDLAEQREAKILEGHLMADHVHILIEIPPKYSVAQVVGYIKGKSAIHIARTYEGRIKNFTGQHMWARGYFVSTVGLDETMIREYIIGCFSFSKYFTIFHIIRTNIIIIIEPLYVFFVK